MFLISQLSMYLTFPFFIPTPYRQNNFGWNEFEKLV